MNYSFHIKKIAAAPGTLAVTKARQETSQEIQKSRYLLESGRTNHEELENSIREALTVLS